MSASSSSVVLGERYLPPTGSGDAGLELYTSFHHNGIQYSKGQFLTLKLSAAQLSGEGEEEYDSSDEYHIECTSILSYFVCLLLISIGDCHSL